jgi:hypothetical protein
MILLGVVLVQTVVRSSTASGSGDDRRECRSLTRSEES